ncbi:TPA: hypothetical protein ENX78_16670 [Candidatus Poribacteria bacterium]|nr:hypothetical protein [Candidatus Poribacteria bacterium]
MNDTLNFAIKLMKEYNVTPLFSRLLPMLGTEVYNIAIERGYINQKLTQEIMARGNQETGISLVETEEFNTGDINAILKAMRKKTFFHQLKCLLHNPKLIVIKFWEQGPETIRRFYYVFSTGNSDK